MFQLKYKASKYWKKEFNEFWNKYVSNSIKVELNSKK
jgi:hypothetical protein